MVALKLEGCYLQIISYCGLYLTCHTDTKENVIFPPTRHCLSVSTIIWDMIAQVWYVADYVLVQNSIYSYIATTVCVYD